MNRRLIVLPAVAIVSLVAGLLGVFATTSDQPAAAADASQFNAGNIISDALFFDGTAMSATEVQSTLAGKVSACRSGYTCLKDYRQTTATRAAVAGRCDVYTGAANELASAIIAKVGAACGVSQKAIIVLLEKEQGLVTDTSPGSGQYRSATGYGCPDTAACDSQYYGFFNQVYNAALQFKRYAANPTGWNHVAGRVNAIRYSPSASCGSSNVFIQNQATAGLYNYTPYQPNAAALANLYGTGDGCSAYGNRNFWRTYTDWFGSTTGTSLVRTTANATVYIVSGTNKYPISNQAILTAYAPLGQIGYVSQSYLDGYKTMQVAGRVMRSPNGTIYFTDASIKLPFGSCALVTDYGGTCDVSGFVQLTDDQLAAFANGPAMGPILGTTAGTRYYVTAGTKREILDNASQTAAGLPGGFNVLTENAVSALPYASPVVRDGVFATQRGTSSYTYLGNNLAYRVDSGAVVGAKLPSTSVGSLTANSLALIPKGATSFTGVVQVPGSASKYVLADGGSYQWNTGSASALTSVAVPQTFLTAYPSKGTIVAGSMIKTPSSATVYIVMADKLLPVGAWESLVALAGGKTPVISTVPDSLAAAIPKGPVALTSNTLVRSDNDATVYLINGVTTKVAMSSFAFATEAGITNFSYTTQDRIDAYPKASTLLGFGLTCGTTDYVSAGGSVHKLDPSLKALYPFTYVALDTYTCQLLKVGTAATKFIRTPNGSIFWLDAGKKRPISSMQRYQELSQGAAYLDVHAMFGAAIPSGPAA